MPDIKLGSLFDGIGVFPLAASRCGIRPVWASEIEKAPISIRFLTETESERLMGLPEGWTKYGADGVEIRPLQRYKALGNAIALPCADYIMAGIYEVLADRAGKEE